MKLYRLHEPCLTRKPPQVIVYALNIQYYRCHAPYGSDATSIQRCRMTSTAHSHKIVGCNVVIPSIEWQCSMNSEIRDWYFHEK